MISARQNEAGSGWASSFPVFCGTASSIVRESLQRFVTDASPEQLRAWDDSIPALQREAEELVAQDTSARSYTAVLEYELPMESRRADAVFLLQGAIASLEVKGKKDPSRADIDQAAAYARDLRCYHREAEHRPVHAILVPMRARGRVGTDAGVHIVGPDAIDRLLTELPRAEGVAPSSPASFLSYDAYRPLPTIVQAARELFSSRKVRVVHRARASTEPALAEISRIVHEAARTRTRRLILLAGVPGAGKTLVGLQAVHAEYLDDLAVSRSSGKPTAPAVFLSGNGPLVQVLQYEFSRHGVNGQTFVRGVFDYVKRYSTRPDAIPPEHVLVFDEAQRAFDAEEVRERHAGTPGFTGGKSEPEHFIEFAQRIPEWCVVIGLIGSGQEIHVGEEAGLGQWRAAIDGGGQPSSWTVHLPPHLATSFAGGQFAVERSRTLSLDTEIRFHCAKHLHQFVQGFLGGEPGSSLRTMASRLEAEGYHLRVTRDLDVAKVYLRERYREHTEARFGLIASSKDKDLVAFGVDNDFQATKQIKYGPWYADGEDAPGGHSCRHLKSVVTEFGAQGLELDASLVAWGTDWLWDGERWSNAYARGYRKARRVKDARQLRLNAYRVLLTRGRDATVVYAPQHPTLDSTYNRLLDCGFRGL